MKPMTRWTFAFAAVAMAWLSGAATSMAADAEGRAAAAARAKDPAWKPACTEVALIQVGEGRNQGALKNFCLNAEGNILACYAPQTGATTSADPKHAPSVRVYSPDGKLLKTLPLEIKPVAIAVGKDGSIFVAGEGRLLKLDPTGKVLASAESPVANVPVNITKETEEMVQEMAKQTRRSFKDELAKMQTSLERRRSDVTGLAVTGEDVFMAVPAPSEFTYQVYRFDQALANPKLVVQKLRGCCGQMDIQAHDGKLWIPHNARHAIECRDREGTQVTQFGKRGKVKATDFGGCCEPKCMRVLPNGDILAAESGPPTCIKRFSSTGEFLGVIALLETEGECVRVTVDASPDGKRYYMMDTKLDAIHVFAAKN